MKDIAEGTRESVMDAYIDETWLEINGSPCLIYATIIPQNIEEAIAAVANIKIEHGLGSTFEIKWSSNHPDAALKARLKQHVIELLGRHFTCLFTVTASSDKDEAFLRTIDHVSRYAVRERRKYVNLFHDQDAYRSRSRIRGALAGSANPTFTTLGELDSSVSVPIQLADLAAGTFRYMVLSALGALPPKLVSFDNGQGGVEQWSLSHLFRILLRWSVPGVGPELDPHQASYSVEDLMKRCVGEGVVIDDRFGAEESSALQQAATFYVGCMH